MRVPEREVLIFGPKTEKVIRGWNKWRTNTVRVLALVYVRSYVGGTEPMEA
jgi:hypothetical protein